MKAHRIDTHLLVPSSRSFAKVRVNTKVTLLKKLSLLIYAPMISKDQGHFVLPLSVCLSETLTFKLNIGHNSQIVSDRALIFHMCIPFDKTFPLVPISRSSFKVKHQSYIFGKHKI